MFIFCLVISALAKAQEATVKTFTHADTLRGSITPQRIWWDVLKYDITIHPDYENKTSEGKNTITYKVVSDNYPPVMQIDLQQPLQIDSIVLNGSIKSNFTKEGNAWFVQLPKQKKNAVSQIDIFFHGKPHEAIRAPWDGGWTFTKDSLRRPWMTVTCQGLGASVWYPCKDHQSDEPDNGATLSIIVPDTLVAVANGRLHSKTNNANGTTTYKWDVVNPINNYDIIPYIGKYVNFSERYNGEKGKLDLNYWVLDYNEGKAKQYMPNEVHNMLKAFEYWFGPYPFYEDGYKLIDVPHNGMEHQSAVAYGNLYKPGYRQRDVSGTGWGMKWDFIIVHESGHEWFGNNITSKDIADMWIHEGFTNYSETLFVEYMYGKEAANEYNAGSRKSIKNDRPVIAHYGVNEEGSGDMYSKCGNMLHTIRHSINNDSLFRQILKGLNTTFYHQTVTTKQVEDYISKLAAFNYNKVFDQYLTTTQIPTLQLKFSSNNKKVSYRWTNCVKGFNLPLVLKNDETEIKIWPTENWKNTDVKDNQAMLFQKDAIEKMYYIMTEVL
ncbi:M1 family metallopeptidase [Segetibacter koreensis]|uniref:M1 family metallopeptidase n=1 Tax=Segetibacter koreensis TaxID=398037 RepID=UPI001FE016B4|nr:M1 family metallopeptidase [Segetibacter koreensis]